MQEAEKRRAGVSRLLIESALSAALRQRLLESPDEVFQDYNLSGEEQELLREPDHRLLRLLGSALAEERADAGRVQPPREAGGRSEAPHAILDARTLPGISLALTLVPCAQYENGQFSKLAYAVWVNPLAEGADPASLPMPQGAALPGQPLTPLHAVIQVSIVQMQDRDGKPQVALSASLQRSSNVAAPPPPEAAGRPEAPPFGSDANSTEVSNAVAAVRSAASGERYDKLLDLMHALRGGEVR